MSLKKYIPTLTLRRKLFLGFALILAMVAVMIASSIYIMSGTTGSLKTIQEAAFPQAMAGIELENSIQLIVLGIESSADAGNSAGLASAQETYNDLNTRIDELTKLLSDDQRAVDVLAGVRSETAELLKLGDELVTATIFQEWDQVPGLLDDFGQRKVFLLSKASVLRDDGVVKLEGAITDINSRSKSSVSVAIFLGVVVLLVGALIVFLLSLAIIRPINKLVELMQSAEHGDFTARFENAALARCWEELQCGKPDCPAYEADDLRCWQIAGTHCEHGSGSEGIGSDKGCDGCHVYRNASVDEFSSIGEAFNNMMVGLVNLFLLIKGAAGEVLSASGTLQGLSGQIREGSSQQASSVDDVTSSVEEMNSTIKNVAQSVESYYSTAEESNTSILEMSASIDQVAGSADQLTNIVEDTSTLLDELTVSIRQVADNSSTLSDQVEQSSSALMEIDTSIKDVAVSAKESSQLSSLVTERLTNEGATAVQQSVNSIMEVRDIVTDAAAVIQTLGEKSADIGQILNVIDEISDQTRLLSLNAAILAAQSGQQGRAFAVVAEEIRALSERSSSSTQQITDLLQSIPEEVQNVTRAIAVGTSKAAEGVKLIQEVDGAIQEVSEAAVRAEEASGMIMGATEEQATGIKQAAQLEQGIANMSREIAQATGSQARNCDQIIASAQQMKDLAIMVKKATEEQSSGTRLISSASNDSMKMARNITDATREEARGSELIVKSIDAVSQATSQNLEVFAQLEEMVGTLSDNSRLLQDELGRFRIETNGASAPAGEGKRKLGHAEQD
jgi:methyl-accepting chemotaxis protein